MKASRRYQIGYVIIEPGDEIPEDLLKNYPHIKAQNERGDKANKARSEAEKAKGDSTDKVKVN